MSALHSEQMDVKTAKVFRGWEQFIRDKVDEEVAQGVIDRARSIDDVVKRLEYFSCVALSLKTKSSMGLRAAAQYRITPVGIREFVQSAYYLDKAGEVYPKVLDELEKMNSPLYQEIVLTGGIGSAKTSCALFTIAYQVYLLSCMDDPHAQFGMDSSSEILFVFQSISKKISQASFDRFRSMIQKSPYFKNHFPFNKDLGSKMVFPNRIEIVPVSGSETAAIGQNVIGGLIDELNYMTITERSSQSIDGGVYNQAIALYNSIARRRKTRFMSQGNIAGKLCLVSSKRYPNQFTDIKEEEAKRDPTIYVYDKRVWEVKPEGSFSGRWFTIFKGTEDMKPRVVRMGETITAEMKEHLMQIPVEFREDFDKDIVNALREIAGVSTLASHPYFIDVAGVNAAFGHHESVFSQESTDFVSNPLTVRPKLVLKPELPRFAHIDLALTGDSAGLTIGTVTGFATMRELGVSPSDEIVPLVHIDGILEIAPPKNGEILFYKIRSILSTLRDNGINIKWVTFDSYQSRDSIQLLRQQGFLCGTVSVDTSTLPYDITKTIVYSGALKAPAHNRCKKEMICLEKIANTGKIDHPPNGSKDCSDSLAGVVYGLYRRAEIWSMYNIPISAQATGMKETQSATLI